MDPSSRGQLSATRELPRRVNVLGVEVSAVDISMVIAEVSAWVRDGEHHYVCVTGVHGVMESQRDPALAAIHNSSGVTTPDGMPMVWAAHWAGEKHVTRVYGPDLMIAMLEYGAKQQWSSFFYGGAAGVAEELVTHLAMRVPGLRVAGTYAPPFRPLTSAEDDEVVARINDSGADLVWVGLSTPKQERWMAAHVDRLNASALFGVGAAFDFHAGKVVQAPRIIQRCGFEWAFRLAVEPRRLWRRYLRNNPAFVARILRTPPRRVI